MTEQATYESLFKIINRQGELISTEAPSGVYRLDSSLRNKSGWKNLPYWQEEETFYMAYGEYETPRIKYWLEQNGYIVEIVDYTAYFDRGSKGVERAVFKNGLRVRLGTARLLVGCQRVATAVIRGNPCIVT
jgi:hypothetical protein